MKALPVKDQQHIERFLESMRFRYPRTAVVYRCMLRGFVRDVRAHKGNITGVTEKTLRAWMGAHRGEWPARAFVDRAQLIDRFLSWKRQNGHSANNPFDKLRSQYGGSIAPVVRALRSADSATELQNCAPFRRLAALWVRRCVNTSNSCDHWDIATRLVKSV
jgi:integrase/recombinase XerD